MNYTEMNKLIAEFMGYKEDEIQAEDWCGCNVIMECEFTGEKRMTAARYETSWDWLMPVGKKIYDYMQAYDRPNENAVCQGDWLETNIGCAIREYDMAKAHENIIEFINWYNSNLPTPSIA